MLRKNLSTEDTEGTDHRKFIRNLYGMFVLTFRDQRDGSTDPLWKVTLQSFPLRTAVYCQLKLSYAPNADDL